MKQIIAFSLILVVLAYGQQNTWTSTNNIINNNFENSFQAGNWTWLANYGQWFSFNTEGAGGNIFNMPSVCPYADNYFANSTGGLFCVNGTTNMLYSINTENMTVGNSWSWKNSGYSTAQFAIKNNVLTILSMSSSTSASFQVFNTTQAAFSCNVTTTIPTSSDFTSYNPQSEWILYTTSQYINGDYQTVYNQLWCNGTDTVITQINFQDMNYITDLWAFNQSSVFLTISYDYGYGDIYMVPFKNSSLFGSETYFDNDYTYSNSFVYWKINDTHFVVSNTEGVPSGVDIFLSLYTITQTNSTYLSLYNVKNLTFTDFYGDSPYVAYINGSTTMVVYFMDSGINSYALVDIPTFSVRYFTNGENYEVMQPFLLNNKTLLSYSSWGYCSYNTLNTGNGQCIAANFELLGNYTDFYSGDWVYVLTKAYSGDNSFLVAIQKSTSTINNLTVPSVSCGSPDYFYLGDVVYMNNSTNFTYVCDGDIHTVIGSATNTLSNIISHVGTLLFPTYANGNVWTIEDLDSNWVTVNSYSSSNNQEQQWRTYCGTAAKINSVFAVIANCNSTTNTENTTTLSIWNIPLNSEVSSFKINLVNITTIAPIGATVVSNVPTVPSYMAQVSNGSICVISPSGTISWQNIPLVGNNPTAIFGGNNTVTLQGYTQLFTQLSVYTLGDVNPGPNPNSGAIMTIALQLFALLGLGFWFA